VRRTDYLGLEAAGEREQNGASNAWFPGFRKAVQRNALQFRRHAAGMCGFAANAEKWMPQTLALLTFLRRFCRT